MAINKPTLNLGPLVELSVTCDLAEDSGIFAAYLTDQVDTWGKRTVYLLRADGDLDTVYLFPDEYEVLDGMSEEG